MLIFRLLFWLMAIIVIAFTVVVAVANRGVVEFSLAPLPVVVSMPLYAVIFLSLLLGVLLGWLVALASGFRRRRRAAENATLPSNR